MIAVWILGGLVDRKCRKGSNETKAPSTGCAFALAISLGVCR